MKRLSLIVALIMLVAGGAVGSMAAPAEAQVYGYSYPAPPPNPYATPWVGANTPWTFYQGDWFLNGILQYFFGPQYGWAPYYAYPTVYIVRPANWYGPRWNVWYQHNPHYWRSFTAKYPYWCGHRVGQRYDQSFYNAHHRGQGHGWHQGFHGVRPPAVAGPGPRGPAAPAPGVRPHGAAGYGGPPAKAVGPAVRTPGGPAPGVNTHGVRGPGPTGPAVHAPAATGPGGHGPKAAAAGGHGPAVPAPGAAAVRQGPGGNSQGAHKGGKTPPAERRHPE
jgi:hypothetical protein